MAAEAVLKVRDAERQNKTIIEHANEQARQITAEAERAAQEMRKNAVRDARTAGRDLVEAAATRAEQESAELLRHGEAERERLSSPEAAKLEEAINFVIERIVNANGNR